MLCTTVYCSNNLIFSIAPPRLLFTLITPYIRRVDLDGRRIITLYTGGQPRGIDFDYRYSNTFTWNELVPSPLHHFHIHAGETTCSGQMTHITGFGQQS